MFDSHLYLRDLYPIAFGWTDRIDFWNLISAYFGLILLTGVFAAIGIFSSSITDSQIIAFLTAMFLMFLFYYGFEGLGSFNLLGRLDLVFQKLSLVITTGTW